MLRRFAVGFFGELADLEGVVQVFQSASFQDVTVTGFRPRGFNAEGDQMVLLRRGFRLAQGVAEGVGIVHHMVGGEDGHDLIRLVFE